MELYIMRIILILINKKITRASHNLNKCCKWHFSTRYTVGITKNRHQETNT
jgi:hypothetical protein